MKAILARNFGMVWDPMTSFWIWSVIVPLMYMSKGRSPEGRMVSAGALALNLMEFMAKMNRYKESQEEARVFNYMAQFKPDDRTTLAQLMASGAVKSVIDRTFPLEETADAMAMQGSNHISGKVVIVIQDQAEQQAIE